MAKYFYPLLKNPYRKKDINSAIKVLKTKKLTIGLITKKFENKFRKKIGVNKSLMVNSGSSALILALKVMDFKKK